MWQIRKPQRDAVPAEVEHNSEDLRVVTMGDAGAFAGRGSGYVNVDISNAGGGGAALGAHVFVRPGAPASLTLLDVTTDPGMLAPGNQGGEYAGNGLALGGVPGAVHVLRSLQAEADLVMAVDGYPTIADLTPDALVRCD